jgi:hypothetical protein
MKRQGNMTLNVKNHTAKNLNDSEGGDVSNSVFKGMMIRMINEIKEHMNKQFNEIKVSTNKQLN